MTEPESALPARPWTPGPWSRTDYVGSKFSPNPGAWSSASIHDGGEDVDDCDINDAIAETGGVAREADAAARWA